MRKIRGITCIILVLLMSGYLPGQEKKSKSKTSAFKFKLGILYINSPTGKRFKKGIMEAIAKYSDLFENKYLFDTIDFPYNNESEGVEILVSLMKSNNNQEDTSKKVDIILGPTESGVFVRAIEQREELEKAEIPVISSQVTAKVSHQVGGWFFRTNINVERRAQVIYDFLNKYWVRSTAILYEENEFGRRAEAAFAKELQGQQKNLHLPLSYSSTDKARSQIRRILAQRPESVGIFGNRADIARLFTLLKNLNAGSTRYFPLTFSIIDTRVIQNNLEPGYSVYFVSVTDITQNKDFDDVKALSYDTTAIILGELHALAEPGTFNYKDRSWRQTFRNRFEAILNGSIGIRKDEGKIQLKTRISFKDYENQTTPRIFKLSRETISPVKLGKTITFPGKVWNKVKLIWDRFGIWPIINLVIIFIVIVFMSIKDIKRWWWGKSSRLFKRLHFWLLLLVNIAIAYAVYFYLGETGNLRYDSVLMALILSLTPSTLLHITLFETSAGKTIGLARYYDNFLQWIYEKMAIKNYKKNKFYINVIAYHNSVYGMKSILNDIYQNTPDKQNKEQRRRMETMVEEVLKEADSWLGRRKALALIVLQKLGWEECVEHNLVPKDLKEYNPDHDKSDKPGMSKNHKDENYIEELKKYDPEEIVLEAAHYCAQKPLEKLLIDEKINAALNDLTSERKIELKNDHTKDLSEMKTSTAIMRKKITFLFLLKGVKKDFSENIKYSEGSKSKNIAKDACEYCKKNGLESLVKEEIEKLINYMWKENENKDKEQKEKYLRIFQEEFKCKLNNKGKLECTWDKNKRIDEACLKKGIKFLFTYHGWDENILKNNGLLPAEYTYQEPQREEEAVL